MRGWSWFVLCAALMGAAGCRTQGEHYLPDPSTDFADGRDFGVEQPIDFTVPVPPDFTVPVPDFQEPLPPDFMVPVPPDFTVVRPLDFTVPVPPDLTVVRPADFTVPVPPDLTVVRPPDLTMPPPDLTVIPMPAPDVAVLGAAGGGRQWLTDVVNGIARAGGVRAVDLFEVQQMTPTFNQLLRYSAVLVFSDAPFQDAAALGDVLADYYDAGGQVVLACFAQSSVPIRGRFGTLNNGYMLFNPLGQEQPNDSLGAILEPQSPLVKDLVSLSAMQAFRSTGTLVNGAVVVAQWKLDNRPLIVRGVVKGRNRADLNFYPPSSAVRNDLWNGDGFKIMRNALLYR